MLESYEAVLEHGQLKWLDTPPSLNSARVIVTVLPKLEQLSNKPQSLSPDPNTPAKRQLGFMKDEMTVPADIHWGDEQVNRLFGLN